MTSTAPAPGVDLAIQANEYEALLLAELLRSSRLSLLYAASGADTTGLLRHRLMPLLCRRQGEGVGSPDDRESGLVVPFPHPRGRSSVYQSKRGRDIVVYFDNWTDTPLKALRETLYKAVAADQADRVEANGPLSRILDALSQRFDAHFIVLLDRVEDLLHRSSNEAATDHFTNELAEAVNQPQLAANFLIALAEEAKPRLAFLRARIAGFDDSSLRLAPPRDVYPAGMPGPVQEAVISVIEALPVLTKTVDLLNQDSLPAPAGALQIPAKRKSKQPPLSRVEVRTEHVYTMIESALARIAMKNAG